MRVERYGSGPQVFLGLHGWNGSHRTFLPLVDEMPEGATFLSVDLPGCGDSAAPATWDLNRIAEEVALEFSGPVTLVGNCSGAILALLIARLVPERVMRVVMIDAFAEWPWYFRVFLSRHLGRYAYRSTFANPVGRWLTNLSLRGKRQAGTNLTQGFQRVDHDVMYQYLTMLRDLGPAAQFADLRMPIDVLCGERTFAAVRDSAFAWAQMWPQARVVELRGAGHLPIVEATPVVKEILFGETLCLTRRRSRSRTSTR